MQRTTEPFRNVTLRVPESLYQRIVSVTDKKPVSIPQFFIRAATIEVGCQEDELRNERTEK